MIVSGKHRAEVMYVLALNLHLNSTVFIALVQALGAIGFTSWLDDVKVQSHFAESRFAETQPNPENSPPPLRPRTATSR